MFKPIYKTVCIVRGEACTSSSVMSLEKEIFTTKKVVFKKKGEKKHFIHIIQDVSLGNVIRPDIKKKKKKNIQHKAWMSVAYSYKGWLHL